MAEAGMTEGRVALPAGHSLFLSQSVAGDGPPVLFLNSLAADRTMWSGVRAALANRSVAYDARGHGDSDIVPGDATVADLAADALAVMDASGLDRAVLCGLSLGGLTAMHVAGTAPDRVAGLVLANTAPNFPPESMWRDRMAQARDTGFAAMVQPTLERWLTADFRARDAETATAVREMLERMPPEGYAAACAALATGDETAHLQGWQGPTLLIAGAHDQSTPVARHEEMKALAPQAEMVVLDAAHVSAIERPAEFAAALARFIGGLAG